MLKHHAELAKASTMPDLLMAHGTVAELCTWFIQIERAGRYLSSEQVDNIWNTSLKLLIYALLCGTMLVYFLGCLKWV